MVDWVGDKPGTFVNESTIVPVDAANLNAINKTVDKMTQGGKGIGIDAEFLQGKDLLQLMDVSDENLNVLYSFDSTASTDLTIVDESANNNSGTASAQLTFIQGEVGKAASFNGTAYVSGTYSNNSAFTLSCWYKGTASGDNKLIVMHRAVNDARLCVGVNNGVSYFSWKNASGVLQSIAGSAVNDGIYHLITATHDGTSGHIFVDGILISSLSQSLNSDYNSTLRICADSGITPTISTAIIDDVRIYTRALSIYEAYGLFFNRSKTRSMPISPNPIANTVALRNSDGDLVSGCIELVNGNYYLCIQSTGTQTTKRHLNVNVNDADRTLSLGGNLLTSGADLTLRGTASTDVILPATGTLSTLAGEETLTNKTLTSPKINDSVALTATSTQLNHVDATSSIQDQLDSKAPKNSPTLTGTPLAPTASVGTDSTQIATTEFVNDEIDSNTKYLKDFKTWSSSTTYAINEPVFYLGVPYKSLQNSNTNNQPNQSSLYWAVTGGGSTSNSIGVGINFANGQFEQGLTGWNLYRDTPGTSPVDGTDGTPVGLSITYNTTTPLCQSGSMTIVKEVGTNSQGSGVSYDFTLDLGATSLNSDAQAQYIQVKFKYKSTATNSLAVFLYDKENSVLLSNILTGSGLSNILAIANDVVERDIVFINTNKSKSLRIIFHCTTTVTTAWTCDIDDVEVSDTLTALLPSVSQKQAMSAANSPSSGNAFVTESEIAEMNKFMNYDSTKTYASNVFTTYNGNLYKSLQSSNNNHTPDTSPLYWKLITDSDITEYGYNFTNGRFQNGLTGYVTYKDSIQATPVDGTGGTALYTSIALNTTSPLEGKVDAIITKSASNGQGEGISYDFTIDPSTTIQVTQISFVYKTSTNYADGGIGVYLYDITNSNFIPLSVTDVPSTYSSYGKFLCTFIPSTSTSYRLILHCQTAVSSEWTFEFDNIQVGQKNVAIGAAISNPIAFTPTISGMTFTSILKCEKTRVGSKLRLEFYAQVSTRTGVFTLTLPDGLSALLSGVCTLGTALVWDANAGTSRQGVVVPMGLNGIAIRDTTGASYWGETTASPLTWSSNCCISLECEFTVSQWVSNINLASDFTEYASNDGSGGVAVNSTYDTGTVYGSGGSLIPNISATSTLGVYRTGYLVTFKNKIQPTDRIIIETQRGPGNPWVEDDTCRGTLNATAAYGMSYLPKNEYSLYINFGNAGPSTYGCASFGAVSSNVWSNLYAAGYRWRVRKVSNGNMAEIPAIVSADAIYTSVTTTTSGAIPFTSIEEDTNSCLTLSTGRFTCSLPGRYLVTGMMMKTSTSNSLTVYKNGTLKRYLCAFPTVNAPYPLTSTIRLLAGDYIDIRLDGVGIVTGAVQITWLGK